MPDEVERKRDWSWVAPGIILVVMTLLSFAASGALDSLEEKIDANKTELKENMVGLHDDITEVKEDVHRYSEKLSHHVETHPSKIIFVELGTMQEKISNLEKEMHDV